MLPQHDNSLENEIFESLSRNGCDFSQIKNDGFCLGVAVSGGADSVCLLIALSKICKKQEIPLKIITVDHKIRSEAESGGDASFVLSLCENLKKIGYDVEGVLYALEDGEVEKTAEKRKGGIEEAARFLRYKAFCDFANKYKVKFICLAHNQNDQLETILMRFLQGSGTWALRGIREKRDIFLRPMLGISRSQIEEYLTAQNVQWRTDNTNFNEKYFRNRVRNSLIPLLDEKFMGWRQGVLSAARKFGDDDDFLEEQRALVGEGIKSSGKIEFDREKLSSLSRAVLVRIIFKAISELDDNVRFPYSHVCSVMDALLNGEKNFCIEASGVQILLDEKNLYVKIKQNIATDSCFFDIIEDGGKFVFPFGDAFVRVENNFAQVQLGERIFSDIPVPFCIRSRQLDDYVKTASGGKKSVSDFLADSHIPVSLKDMVPVIQELVSKNQEILCVAGSVFGYDDWVCKR